MQSHPRPVSRPESISPRNGIVVLAGYGLKVIVEHGRLVLADGLGPKRRSARLSRATCGLKRLVILGHSGTVSLEALRWLRDVKAAVVQIDADGQLVLAFAPPTEGLTNLRRAQVLAAGRDPGIRIVRRLLTDKVAGQADGAEGAGKLGAARAIRALLQRLSEASDLGAVAGIESKAAQVYWEALADTPVGFARRDERKVPEHWRAFGLRKSPLTGSPRNAANPANAILNYLYAILEAETRIALLTVGLDPGLGLMHADQASRDSLACDVMEALRPTVDSWLLGYLAGTHFAKNDFFERPDGTVRLTSRLTAMLAETATIWAKAVGPVAEWVAAELVRPGGRLRGKELRNCRLPTPLTQANRSAGRRILARGGKAKPSASKVALPRACSECGKPIRSSTRRFCSDECFKAYKADVDLPRFSKAGMARLNLLRAEGADPSHGGEVGRKRGQSNARRAKERSEWNDLGLDVDEEKERFRRDILPLLQGIPLSRIIEATGFSRRYASLARRGLYTPHPVHFDRLALLAGVSTSANRKRE